MAQASVAARVGIAASQQPKQSPNTFSQRTVFLTVPCLNMSRAHCYQERYAKKKEAEDLRRAFERLDTRG